jgi:hypothetical protein
MYTCGRISHIVHFTRLPGVPSASRAGSQEFPNPAPENASQGDTEVVNGGNLSADTPDGLPWLVRLNKYVDGQTHDGIANRADRISSSNGGTRCHPSPCSYRTVPETVLVGAGLVPARKRS